MGPSTLEPSVLLRLGTHMVGGVGGNHEESRAAIFFLPLLALILTTKSRQGLLTFRPRQKFHKPGDGGHFAQRADAGFKSTLGSQKVETLKPSGEVAGRIQRGRTRTCNESEWTGCALSVFAFWQPFLQGSLKDTFCPFETWLFPPK